MRVRPNDQPGGLRNLNVGWEMEQNVNGRPEMAKRHHVRLGETRKPHIWVMSAMKIGGMRRIGSIVYGDLRA